MPEITKKQFEDRLDGIEAVIHEGTRDVISHFSQSQAGQDKRIDERFETVDRRFDEVDAKLDAVMELLATRKELHNLVRALKQQGIRLEETEIFRV